MIMRYEAEVRRLLATRELARSVRTMRVDQDETWRGIGERSPELWAEDVGRTDTQSLGTTMCHVAAEMLGEDPDAPPWN